MDTGNAGPDPPLLVAWAQARWLTHRWHAIARGDANTRRADLFRHAAGHLAALERELAKQGVPSTLHTGTSWPSLRIHTPSAEPCPWAADPGDTVVAVYLDGRWSYYSPRLETIGDVHDPAAAAITVW